MHRILAIIERDLRRFRRSPALIVISMIMPLVQLVILGYAFGGKVKHLNIGVVDRDHGLPAVQLKEMFQAVAANAQTFDTAAYADTAAALRDLREGKINGVLEIPPDFSRKVLAGASPRVVLAEDNTDQFSSAAMEGAMAALLPSYRQAALARADHRRRDAGDGGDLSLCALHPVSAAGHDCAGDFRHGDDRRRHYLYR